MNITYLIGNGFDIALGLKTRYSDFIDYYCGLDKSNSRELQILQQEMSRQDPETRKLWSCAERAFGIVDWSALSPGDPVGMFKTCLHDFQAQLVKYLEQEWHRVVITDDGGKLADDLFKRMIRIDRFLGRVHANRYLDFVRQHGKIVLNFVVFNYTDTLEQLWMSKPPQGDVGCRCFDLDIQGKIPVEVQAPCFVHGDFVRKWYMFGVDNASQIKDPAVRKSCEASGQLIKPMMDADLGIGSADAASSLIKNSDVLVTYGLSFGSSDLSWSDLVFRHTFGDKRQLVICPYYETQQERSYSADQPMQILQQELRKVFASLVEEKKLTLDVSRDKISNVRILDEVWAGVAKPHCDYFNLAELGKKIVR